MAIYINDISGLKTSFKTNFEYQYKFGKNVEINIKVIKNKNRYLKLNNKNKTEKLKEQNRYSKPKYLPENIKIQKHNFKNQ